MKKPREFCIFERGQDGVLNALQLGEFLTNDAMANGPFNVREVIEISEAEITEASKLCADFHVIEIQAFKAGARWAIAKLTGEGNG